MSKNISSYFYRKENYPHLIFYTLVGLLLLYPTKTMAQGDLLLFPKRLVFEGQKRTQELNLCNTGKDTAKYNISFVEIRMKEDGSFENITVPDPGQFFASTYLRVFPRQVTLAPNESQTVKVQVSNTSTLGVGEYRSHLYFRSLPSTKPLGEPESSKEKGAISVRLVPVYGISIPIIIRKGESSTRVSLSNLSLEYYNDLNPILRMDFNRTGNMSAYGDIVVNYISPEGKIIKVGSIQGFAVYTPGGVRKCKIELKKTEGINYQKGKLVVTYLNPSEGKDTKLAEAELLLK